jgi:predicted dehydrogenase
MKKVRMGIIGFGTQGGYYAGFLHAGKVDNTELAAICDFDPSREAASKEKYPEIPFFTDHIAMMESGLIDAVVVCAPHFSHPEIGMQALERNLHALIEKPAGVYGKQVQELNAFAASKPELTYGIMFNQRTNPLYQKVKAIIDSGELGQIRRTNWIITTWWRPQAYYNSSEWRATWKGEGGGVLVNQAPHQLDLLQWLCGMPKKVYSNVKYGYQRDIEVEDEVTAVLDYGNGATGVFITCTHDLLGTDRLEILLDGGKIIVDDSKKVTIKRLVKSETELNRNMTPEQVRDLFMGKGMGDISTEEVIEFESTWMVQHPNVFYNFAANILEGTPLLAPGSDGIHGVHLANAIHLSSFLGKEIELPLDDELFYQELRKRMEGGISNG